VYLAVIGVVAAALTGCGYNGQGSAKRVACGDGSRLSLDYAVRQAPLDFEIGPKGGYRLAWTPRNRSPIDLYNDGFPQPGTSLANYVGWTYQAGAYLRPQPTYTFAPLPGTTSGMAMRIFELPTRRYDPSAEPWRKETPPFMNIFLDPTLVSRPDFEVIAACLAQHRDELNQAFARLGTKLGPLQRFYLPLRLGGVVLGPPPYGDPAYRRIIRELWGDAGGERNLPAVGRFTLFDGEVAHGKIDGHEVRLSIQGGQRIETLDGAPFDLGVVGDGVCTGDLQHCAKLISAVTMNDDGSMTYDIAAQTKQNVYESELSRQ
jgi:hypothetical protein